MCFCTNSGIWGFTCAILQRRRPEICVKEIYLAPNLKILGIYWYINQIPISMDTKQKVKWQCLRIYTHHTAALPRTYYAALNILNNKHGACVTSRIKLQLWCWLNRGDKCIAIHSKSNLKSFTKNCDSLVPSTNQTQNSKYRAHI